MITKTEYNSVQPYKTKDGSIIRELMHPNVHGNAEQSLAEAIILVGYVSLMHKHIRSEEVYHITQGKGIMSLGDEQFEVNVGDTICIAPGTPHKIQNTGKNNLKILCCSSPAYSHDDTKLLDEPIN